jgi:hypothetical protein
MTLHNALHTGSTAHPVLSALDARLAMSAELALNGPGALDVRLGVMYGPAGFAVTGTSSISPWQYSVPAATFVTSKGATDGPRVGANDGVYLAATVVPPASNSRYDVVYVLQQDADATISPDGTTAPVLAVYNGPASATPSLAAALAAIPAGAYALASALVLSTATAGTSGTGVTITQQFQWTTTRNNPIPVRNVTERGLITPFDGLQVYRLDAHLVESYNGARWTGGTWVAYVPTVTALGGVFGSVAASGEYVINAQNVVTCAFHIVVTTVGSAGSGIRFTLPLPSGSAIGAVGSCREVALTGYMGQVLVDNPGPSADIFKYDGSQLGLAAGAIIDGILTYRAA